MTEVLGWARLAVEVLGVAGVVYWLRQQIKGLKGNITALQGTVAAQKATLDTLGSINKTVVEVFQALDPKRWADEVRVHKQLADEKAQALIEKERAELQREHLAHEENVKGTVIYLARLSEDYLRIALKLMSYVPKALRASALEPLPFRVSWTKSTFLKFAEETPELNLPLGAALAGLFTPPPAEGGEEKETDGPASR